MAFSRLLMGVLQSPGPQHVARDAQKKIETRLL